MNWSRAVRAASTFVSLHGRGSVGLRTLCPDLVAMHVWHSVGPADARRLRCFDQSHLEGGVSSHCELPVFQEQIASIQRDFRIVSFAEALTLLAPGRRGFGWCAVLTFDDGFASTVESALPWLHERGLPSTLFVNADLAGRQCVKDVDLINYCLNHLGAARVADVLGAAAIRVRSETLASKAFDFRSVVDQPAWPVARRRLFEALDVTETQFADELGIYATWDDLRRLPSTVTVGNHGSAHAFLPALSEAEAEREILGGLAAIRRELALTEMPYAFAFGQPQDLPPHADGVARAAHTAVVSAFGGVNPPGSPAAGLRRVPMFSTANNRLRAEYEFPPRTLLHLAGL